MAFKMMENLQKRSGVRHTIDAFDIMSDMQQYFDEVAIIPVYINTMETAQKKAARFKHPISDNMLFDIETKAILTSDRFPQATDAWEEKNDEDKTWAEWKDAYLAANKSHENRLCAAGYTGGQSFSTANAAATPTNNQQVTIQEPHTISEDNLERLDSYFNNMSDAVANATTAGFLDAADISSMSKILETLTLSNATPVIEVASLRADMENSSSQRDNSNPDGRFPRHDTIFPMGTRYPKPTPVNLAPREIISTRRRTPGITSWGAVTGTRDGVPDRKDPTIIKLT